MRPLSRSTAYFLAFAIGPVLLAAPAQAQQANVFMRIDNASYACGIPVSVGVHTATVEVYAYPFRTVRFQAPVPAGAFFLGDTSGPGIAVTGNSQTGVSVTMPSCAPTAPVVVLSISFFVPTAIASMTWEVQPFPGETEIGLTDCTDFPMKGTGVYTIYCDPGQLLGPYKPDPANGATDVPLDVAMSFVGTATEVGIADHAIEWPYQANIFYCETLPIPHPAPNCEFPLHPSGLQPSTTYYWRALNICCCCEHGDFAAGDVWTFTTGDAPLSVNQTTWGRVKALYRE